MKKNVLMLLLLFSCFLIGEQVEKYDVNCSIFSEEEEKDESRYYLDVYTGRTNLKLKDGKSICEMGNSKIEIEVKKRKILMYKDTYISSGELLFSANYDLYGPVGPVYINEGYGWGYSHSMKVMYEKGKPVGEFIEYYSNGNIYRKSKLKRANTYNYFGYLDYKKYIDGEYEIYDYDTGKLIYTGNIINGTGKVVEYSSDGSLYQEYELKKGKKDGKSYMFNDKKEIKTEKDYVKGEIIKEVEYNDKYKYKRETIYIDGKKVKEARYTIENELEYLHVIMSESDKYYVERYKDGILIERTDGKYSKNIKKIESFYETGNLKSIRNYVNNRMNGEYKLFDLNGNLIYEADITTKDQEIKYISGVNNGEVLIETIKLDDWDIPRSQ